MSTAARAVASLTGLILITLCLAGAACAEIGRVKTAKGDVQIERDGRRLPAVVGIGVEARDTLITGADGAVGVTFQDNSMLSAGPNSVLVLDKYEFDRRTNQGRFETSLKKGTLAAISGKMVKQTPQSMNVKTPSAIMGVRGTYFVVQVDPQGN